MRGFWEDVFRGKFLPLLSPRVCNIHWHWIASFLASYPHFLTLQVCEYVCVCLHMCIFIWHFGLQVEFFVISQVLFRVFLPSWWSSFFSPVYDSLSQHRFLHCETWHCLPSVEIVDWIFWIERTGNNVAVSAVKK